MESFHLLQLLCNDKMNWVAKAKILFKVEKPDHFTNFMHCDECYEHDQTLLNKSFDTIGFKELGNPGWDPLCYVNIQGMQYYFPALVRLCLNSNEDNSYIGQLCFHLDYEGTNNKYLKGFTSEQKYFVAEFSKHLIESKKEIMELYSDYEEMVNLLKLWKNTANNA